MTDTTTPPLDAVPRSHEGRAKGIPALMQLIPDLAGRIDRRQARAETLLAEAGRDADRLTGLREQLDDLIDEARELNEPIAALIDLAKEH